MNDHDCDNEPGHTARREAASRAVDRRIVWRLLALVQPHRGALALAAVCQLLSTLAFLALPYMIRPLTDSVFVHHDTTALNRMTEVLLVLATVAALFGYLRGVILASVGGRIMADLRIRVFAHIQSLSISFHDAQRVGDLLSRLTSDTLLVQAVVTDNLLSLGQHVLTFGGVVLLLLVLDWRLALVTVVLTPLMMSIGLVVGRHTRRLAVTAQAALGQAAAVGEETLAAQRTVKAFGRERFETTRYGQFIERSFRAGLDAARVRAAFEATVLATAVLAIAGVLWVGSREVLAGLLTAGGLISFLFYLTVLTGPIQALASLYGSVQLALGGPPASLTSSTPSRASSTDSGSATRSMSPRHARRICHA